MGEFWRGGSHPYKLLRLLGRMTEADRKLLLYIAQNMRRRKPLAEIRTLAGV
jgi:hypothetical protein